MSETLERIAQVVRSRREEDPERSYVASLFARGDEAMLKKLGEEAIETVLAARDGDRDALVRETADLWFHSLVLLVRHDLSPADVLAELKRREGMSGLAEKRARREGGTTPGGGP